MRCVAAAFACFAITALLSACGGEGGPRNAVVVLVDTSLSTNGEAARKYGLGLQSVLKFFEDGAGGVLVIDAIGANSLGDSSPVRMEFPHRGRTTNKFKFMGEVRPRKREALARAADILHRAPERSGTSILDALTNSSAYFHEFAPETERYLVIFSDMIEESDCWTFDQTGRGTGGAERLIRDKPECVPHGLEDVHVFAAGAGVTSEGSVDPTRIREAHAFWDRVVAEGGGELESYGATLFAFP